MTAQQRRAFLHGNDRRTGHRYAISAAVEYRVICGYLVIQKGFGRTVNLSRGGVLFESDQALPVGTPIEVSVAWPARLHDTVDLNLCVSGQVVRSAGERTMVRILRHEFCLRGRFGSSKRRINLWPEPRLAAVPALL